MPTILRLGPFRVVIYTADHRPAHVHVIGQGGEAVFILHCPDGPPELREAHGFNLRDVKRIETELGPHTTALCNGWSDIHGDF
ncbi:MAG: DUF4160 domain-containing protein [Paracoccus sp. (in: a-proteobacteria)]|nr:DUF4160 domain-containing protein [Paracoccus sp. (in: a-proteobacteria)]